MENFNVNISAEEVLSQRESEAASKTKPTTKFDAKNYLNTRLSDGEASKTLTIRLLPFSKEGGTPFFKVHMHQVRVNKEVSSSGWKTFPCPIKNGLGKECPFCETSEEARKTRFASVIEQEKEKLFEVETQNRSREFWIVRCIERGHEDDGVKFWLFPSSKKGDGVYDKIMNIFAQRFKKAEAQGRHNNIFDLNEGKDLLITVSKDSNGKTVYNITDDDEKSPLSTNVEQAIAWVNDAKKWNEVYTIKPYEYMEIIIRGGVPYYDRDSGKYVEKSQFDKEVADALDRRLEKPTKDLSEIPVEAVSIKTEEEDDLPF